MRDPVIQQEISGCGMAACAALTANTYEHVRQLANALGIFAHDENLWSDTAYVRRILTGLGVSAGADQSPFLSWQSLPDRALLAIKWRIEHGKPFWHWVVFLRDESGSYVLDSKRALKRHVRRDFGRMKPKWFITVY